jgi:hypothetical protein
MNHPSFREVLIKINEECGSQYDPTYNIINQPNNEPPIEEFACSIHGIQVTVIKTCGSNLLEFKTQMKGLTARVDWVFHDTDPTCNLYIPYFQDFLKNLREVWYEQNGKP